MIFINWVIELINNIPEIISYIAYGYIYLVSYYWISFKDNKDFKNLIIKSVTINYLLITIYDVVVLKLNFAFINEYHKTICYFAISAILGFLIGKITSHRYFNLLLHKLHIGRTTNENIWDDVIKPNTWIRIFMKDGSSYLGQYRYGEPFEREPIVVLATYQKLNKDVDVVIDNSQDPNELIMLNTKDFDRIEITYTETKHCNFFVKIKDFTSKIF